MKFSDGKFARFIASKGFYAAIALCLAGAGIATWLAVDRTIGDIEDSNSRVISAASSELPILEEVEKKQPDVPKVTEPSSSRAASAPSKPQSEPASQSQPASAPQEQSEPADAAQPPQSLSYTLPLGGEVLIPFSAGELVKNTTLNDWRTHDGVDIAGDEGAEVCAASDGTVTEVKSDPLWGTVLTITHADGKVSIYSGLSDVVPVRVGENVLAKQVVGKLAGVPCEMSGQLHLHFAMKQDNAWIDPLSTVNQ